jgi:L-alanine-DL-glutamate epimerase-like enolase superfamily enzyme
MSPLRFTIDEVNFSERDVVLRLPFRFGVVTVRSCPEVFVRSRIRFPDGSTSLGCSAEMMIPKWFDKNPAFSNEQNFEQLRRALMAARDAYCSETTPKSAWQHFAQHYRSLMAEGSEAELNPLTSSYGPALLDRAIFDALCLRQNCSFAAGMSANIAGIDVRSSALASDLDDFDVPAFLSKQRSTEKIAARHTVGLLDAVSDSEIPADAPADGLPCSLEAAVARYGHHHFKIKLSGEAGADIERLRAIASVLASQASLVTLDGNEQYASAEAFADFYAQLAALADLKPLVSRISFVEQPIRRDLALQQDVSTVAQQVPLLIDESDSTLDSFVLAKTLGYTGVSSKSCKGIYKSVLNAARCARWNQAGGIKYFLSGEDLTMQAGVGLQQDLALVGWLGLGHVERNGHHYVNGMMAAPTEEQQGFLHSHKTLYEDRDGAVRLRITDGLIELTSLHCAGFGTGRAGAGIAWDVMRSTY